MPILNFVLEFIIAPIVLIFFGLIIFILGLLYSLWDFPFTWYVFRIYAIEKLNDKSNSSNRGNILDKTFCYLAAIIPDRDFEAGSHEPTTSQIIKYKRYKQEKNAESI